MAVKFVAYGELGTVGVTGVGVTGAGDDGDGTGAEALVAGVFAAVDALDDPELKDELAEAPPAPHPVIITVETQRQTNETTRLLFSRK